MAVIVLRAQHKLHVGSYILIRRRAMHSIFDQRIGLYTSELEDGEPLEKYTAGGFHPVSLGDTYDGGHYRIIHEIGCGGFSTVWLARDQKSCCNVALKISVAHTTSMRQRESAVLDKLKARREDLPGKRYVVNELHSFKHNGPNGSHRVSVMELLGSSAQQVSADGFKDQRLPSWIAQKVAKQAAQAIEYVHAFNIAHGDVHPGNFVFAVPKLQTMPENAIIKALGQPELFPVRRSDLGPREAGVPAYLVAPIRNPIIPDFSKDFEVRLVDFGNSFLEDDPPSTISPPMHVCAPEVALGRSFDKRIDLWSLGCTMFTLFAGGPAFDGFTRHDLIEDMIDKLGPLPEQFRYHYQPRPHESDLADPDDELDDCDFQQWLEVFLFDGDKHTDLTKQHAQNFGELIRKLVQYEPANRIAAADLTSDPLWEKIAPRRAWHQILLQRTRLFGLMRSFN